MKKKDKKIDNSICRVLTLVCESAKADDQGFEWITHRVNYNDFPASLLVTCVFRTQHDLLEAKKNLYHQQLMADIVMKLKSIDVSIHAVKQIDFDTEDALEGAKTHH